VEDSDYSAQRDNLLDSIELDRRDQRVALHDLSRAAGNTLDLGDHIRSSPIAWMLGALLVGAWLGDRAAPSGAAERRNFDHAGPRRISR
jgi:hypothetical protein